MAGTQQVDAATAGRAWFLRGFVAGELDQAEAARAAFRQALLFRPELAWDADYPDDGRATLDAARQDLDRSADPLALAPTLTGATLVLDGHTLAADQSLVLGAGDHLLQIVGDSVLSMVVATPASPLLVPSLATDADLAQLETAEGRQALDMVLDAPVGGDDRVVVVIDARTWLRGADGTWQDLGPPAVDSVDTAHGRGGAGAALRWSGVGLAVVGAGLSTSGYLLGDDAAKGARQADLDGDRAAWEAAEGQYNTAGILLPAGYVALGVGGALLVGGIALDGPGDPVIAPLLLPAGGGLRLELSL